MRQISFNRRRLLKGAAATGFAAANLLPSGGFAQAKTQTINLQLGWLAGNNQIGEVSAKHLGYFEEEKLNVVIQPGGPSIDGVAIVASGRFEIGQVSSSPSLMLAASQKIPVTCFATALQQHPYTFFSLEKKPIRTPKDMIGKKIGVQATNEPVWTAFLKANKIDPSKIDKVTVQFDPTPLTTGDVDGWFSFITNEPNLLKVAGHDTYSFLLNDFNYPLVSEVYVVRKDTLSGERDKLKSLMVAEIKGWHGVIQDPALAANLTVTKYGKDQGLDEAEQTLEAKAENTLILTPDTKANGLFTITPASQAASLRTLKLGGLKLTKKIFDMSLLKEVYAANPNLKKSPV